LTEENEELKQFNQRLKQKKDNKEARAAEREPKVSMLLDEVRGLQD
jgi:chromosome segregation ATPase